MYTVEGHFGKSHVMMLLRTRLNLLKIKVEFEKIYSEIKRRSVPKHLLGFKQNVKLIQSLYIRLLQAKEAPSC